MTRPSRVALHGVAHSFIELDKAVVHVIRLVSCLWLWLLVCLLQMFKLVLEKAEEQEIKLPTSVGSSKNQESSKKKKKKKPIYFWFID